MEPIYAAAPIAARALRRYASLGTIVALSACAPSFPQLNSSLAARTKCPAAHADNYFFPDGALVPRDESEDHEQREILNRYLTEASVEPLSCGDRRSGYRLVRVRGRTAAPIVVTLVNNTLGVVEFFPPMDKAYAARERRSSAVAEELTAKVSSAVNESTFWTANAFVDVEGDGEIWLLEVREGNRYKVVTRVTLDQAVGSPIRALLAAANINR